ncbi:restriction endonuclease subunit S [Clostridium perfringens]|uniref:restriction endonuclease subunit S n=1 Tax=Clostridium perfringens TaxID=1502 RepID=UPI0039E97E3F
MNKKDVLKNLIEIDSGYAFKSSFFNDNFEGIPIIRIRDINSGIAETYYSGDYEEKFIVNNDDLLIGMDGNFKIRKWSGGKALLNQRVCRIKSISNKLSNEYLYRILPLELKLIEDKTSFVTVKHLSVKDINNIELIIPDIDIQNKIVKIIDKSQELIDNRKKQIEELDLLVKSKFIEMFGDPFNDEKGYGIKKLGEVTEVNPKKSEIKELDKDLIVSFVPMDRVSEKGEFAPELSKPISEVYNGFTYFKDNDVLFAKITPCMENGKGAIAINLSNGIGFGSTEFHVLRPIKDNSNPYWIYHLTTLIEFRRLAERKMTGSAGQKRVPTDFLNNVEVVIPPIELQNQFADFAKQVDKLKFEMEKSLKELEDNFNSLMQKAFKGELFK